MWSWSNASAANKILIDVLLWRLGVFTIAWWNLQKSKMISAQTRMGKKKIKSEPYLLVTEHHWECTIHANSHLQQFKFTTSLNSNTLQFKCTIHANSNIQQFKYTAYKFKSVENIYYQVPVYKNRGGCCYSHYLHRWWVGCCKPMKGSSPISGNIVVLTQGPHTHSCWLQRKESTACVRLAVWGTGGGFYMQFCLIYIS